MATASGFWGGYLRERGNITEVHILLGPDPEPPRRQRERTQDGHRRPGRDAGAEAPGELPPGRPQPGRWDEPPVPAENGEEAPTAAGGVNPEAAFIDARSLRISGRDERGKQFEAAVFGGTNPQSQTWAPTGASSVGDARSGLQIGYADDHPRALNGFQKLLNRHYAR